MTRPQDPEQRRTDPRLPLSAIVHFKGESGIESADCVNVSSGGLLLAHHCPPEPGARIDLKFCPPDEDRPYLIEGEVMWGADPGRGKAKLVGIRFDGECDDHTRLGIYLERRHARMRSASPIALADTRTTHVASTPPSLPTCGPTARRYAVSFRDARSFVREYTSGLRDRQLFIRTERPAAPGSRIDIDMDLPNYPDTLELGGRVRRCLTRDAAPQPGLDVDLTDEHPKTLAFVQEYGRVLAQSVSAYA